MILYQDHLEGLFKHRMLALPRMFDSVDLLGALDFAFLTSFLVTLLLLLTTFGGLLV